MLRTRTSLVPGDQIFVPIDDPDDPSSDRKRCRAVFVRDVDPLGVWVFWYTPNGVGPLEAYMPHADLCGVLYRPEAAGESKSHFKMSPQEIVDTDKHLRKVLNMKEEKIDRD